MTCAILESGDVLIPQRGSAEAVVKRVLGEYVAHVSHDDITLYFKPGFPDSETVLLDTRLPPPFGTQLKVSPVVLEYSAQSKNVLQRMRSADMTAYGTARAVVVSTPAVPYAAHQIKVTEPPEQVDAELPYDDRSSGIESDEYSAYSSCGDEPYEHDEKYEQDATGCASDSNSDAGSQCADL